MIPYKGQLALLPAQSNLHYLFGRANGYMFPRKDALVIGGTFEENVNNTTASKTKCKKLVEIMKSNFGLAPVQELPAWHIHIPNMRS